MEVYVTADRTPRDWNPRSWRLGEPSNTALRAYREYHPGMRVFLVTRNGRTVWLTWKQREILEYIDKPNRRNRWLTLEQIAEAVHCSKSTVSRTLVRFDLWRFIDYLSVVGRYGGIWARTRVGRYREEDANLAAAKHTIASRKAARTWLAKHLRLYEFRKRWELKQKRGKPRQWVAESGSTDGMFP